MEVFLNVSKYSTLLGKLYGWGKLKEGLGYQIPLYGSIFQEDGLVALAFVDNFNISYFLKQSVKQFSVWFQLLERVHSFFFLSLSHGRKVTGGTSGLVMEIFFQRKLQKDSSNSSHTSIFFSR